jgi:hypothetical protein
MRIALEWNESEHAQTNKEHQKNSSERIAQLGSKLFPIEKAPHSAREMLESHNSRQGAHRDWQQDDAP